MLNMEPSRGWSIGGLKSERVADDHLEARAIEVDGAALAARFAVVTSDTDAAMFRQDLLEERHLLGRRLLHAQDVGLGFLQGGAQGVFAPRPVELLPGRTVRLAAMHVPGDDADQ